MAENPKQPDPVNDDWLDDLRRFGDSVGWPMLPSDLMRKFGKFSGRRLEKTDATYQALRRDYERLRTQNSSRKS